MYDLDDPAVKRVLFTLFAPQVRAGVFPWLECIDIHKDILRPKPSNETIEQRDGCFTRDFE